mgnify:CR=1 FL=1
MDVLLDDIILYIKGRLINERYNYINYCNNYKLSEAVL